MGVAADKSGIQFRLLNKSRGPAVLRDQELSQTELFYKKQLMQKILLNYRKSGGNCGPSSQTYFENNKVIGFACQSRQENKNCKINTYDGNF